MNGRCASVVTASTSTISEVMVLRQQIGYYHPRSGVYSWHGIHYSSEIWHVRSTKLPRRLHLAYAATELPPVFESTSRDHAPVAADSAQHLQQQVAGPTLHWPSGAVAAANGQQHCVQSFPQAAASMLPSHVFLAVTLLAGDVGCLRGSPTMPLVVPGLTVLPTKQNKTTTS